VRDEQHALALVADAVELVEALLLEGGVADREHLVDEQDVGVDVDHDREAQPHEHAARVVLDLEVLEAVQAGEGDDLVLAPARLRAAEPEHHAVEADVVARGEVHVEAHAELDERRQAPVDPRLARVGLVDARQALQQRRLARPVAADDPEELALGDLERRVLQRLEAVVQGAAERMQRTLLERVGLLFGDAEGLGEPLDDDGWDGGHETSNVPMVLG
jgi:hypothetical protein